MAPEVMSSDERGDAAADVWAVGVMLSDTLLGTVFASEGRGCQLYRPEPRAALLPAAAAVPAPEPSPPPPSELVELVRSMVELKPADRPTVFDALDQPRAWEAVGGAQLQELEVRSAPSWFRDSRLSAKYVSAAMCACWGWGGRTTARLAAPHFATRCARRGGRGEPTLCRSVSPAAGS